MQHPRQVAKTLTPSHKYKAQRLAVKPASDERTAAPFVPDSTSIRTLGAAAHDCRGCDLYKHATQVVFGEGSRGAHVMFIGEQPGDQEDRQGHPFVGPAGAMLDKALSEGASHAATCTSRTP